MLWLLRNICRQKCNFWRSWKFCLVKNGMTLSKQRIVSSTSGRGEKIVFITSVIFHNLLIMETHFSVFSPQKNLISKYSQRKNLLLQRRHCSKIFLVWVNFQYLVHKWCGMYGGQGELSGFGWLEWMKKSWVELLKQKKQIVLILKGLANQTPIIGLTRSYQTSTVKCWCLLFTFNTIVCSQIIQIRKSSRKLLSYIKNIETVFWAIFFA